MGLLDRFSLIPKAGISRGFVEQHLFLDFQIVWKAIPRTALCYLWLYFFARLHGAPCPHVERLKMTVVNLLNEAGRHLSNNSIQCTFSWARDEGEPVLLQLRMKIPGMQDTKLE